MAEDFNELKEEVEGKVEEKIEEVKKEVDELEKKVKKELEPAKNFLEKVKLNFNQVCDYLNTAEWIPSKAFFALLFLFDVIVSILFWIF
jgi:molecular chaperone GrpE (heat shock protein)